MIFKRLPHLFDGWSNGDGDNCRSFSDSKTQERNIDAGSQPVFVSPPVPEKPSWQK